MIYKFRLLSDEVEDFRRDIEIDSDATFYDLHKAILAATGYSDDQMTSFFLCDDRWEKETEITLEDMGSRSDEDNYVMSETVIGDFFEEEKQRMMYVFDPLADRVFFMDGGIIAEKGTPDEVFNHPQNPRTKEFLSKVLY